MLQRPEGATIEEVASAMGWQRHTVRGLFSGTLTTRIGSSSRSPALQRVISEPSILSTRFGCAIISIATFRKLLIHGARAVVHRIRSRQVPGAWQRWRC